jgi:hypothetical protein
MTRKKVVLLLGVALLGAAVLATALSVHAWRGRSAAVYDPAGTWMGVNNYGGTFIVSVTPWGPDRKRVTLVAEGIFDTTRGGTFPPSEFGGPAVANTLQRGWAVRTARNTYELVLVDYAVNEDFQVVYVAVGRYTVVLTGPDSVETTGTAGYFAPDQDPFGDEAPAFGCIPVTAAYERVPMASPCEL